MNNTFIIRFAAVVIVCAGLSAAASVVIPFLLAVFIAIAVSPLIDLLERAGLRRIFTIVIVIFGFFGVLWGLGDVVFSALQSLRDDLPTYQVKFDAFLNELGSWLEKHGIASNYALLDAINAEQIFAAFGGAIKSTGQIVTKSFLVLLLVIFILVDANIFRAKLDYFASRRPQTYEIVSDFISNLKRYLAIKTVSATATAAVIYPALEFFAVPYASVWAALAFILNYIPTVGSIIAAIPALVVSLLVCDLTDALWLASVYLIINVAIGNFIEPRFLGNKLGISTLVVLLSLIFWGFLLGVGGMFLAVPLTLCVKMAASQNESTKFIAILLSDKGE